MDLDAVRTFVTVADTGRFQDAAADLAVTQQAVSKRVARLEGSLGVRLFARTARGAELTLDGRAFLPHARELLRAAERAAASVRPGRRALRVDVIGRRLAPAALLRGFHRAHPGAELDVVTLFDADAALGALRNGAIDASFRAVAMPGRRLPDGIAAVRAYDEPVELLTGAGHPLAGADSVTPAELAGHRLWMPGLVPGTEWDAFYRALAAAFGLTIEVSGPDFGVDPLLDTLAADPSLATLIGAGTRLSHPARHPLRRVPLRAPVPVYPHSLLYHRTDPHPTLAALRTHLGAVRAGQDARGTWTPEWA